MLSISLIYIPELLIFLQRKRIPSLAASILPWAFKSQLEIYRATMATTTFLTRISTPFLGVLKTCASDLVSTTGSYPAATAGASNLSAIIAGCLTWLVHTHMLLSSMSSFAFQLPHRPQTSFSWWFTAKILCLWNNPTWLKNLRFCQSKINFHLLLFSKHPHSFHLPPALTATQLFGIPLIF